MKHSIAAVTLCWLALGCCGWAQQPLPEEIQRLQPLIGEWNAEITTGPLDDRTKWNRSQGSISIQSILDGHYLQVTTKNGDNRFIWIIGFDADKKKYRRFSFTNAGQINESEGDWNGEFRMIDWKTLNERPGPTQLGQDYIGLDAVALGQGKEILKISILASNAQGKSHQVFGCTATRRK